MKAGTDNIAIYVDLLGFRSLLQCRPELARPDGWDLSEPLGMFNGFHSTLDAYAFDALDSNCERFFSWSDCCFVDFGSLTDLRSPGHPSGALYRAVLDAARLMQTFIQRQIPVRIGIGLGSFETVVVRQQVEEQPRRLIVSSRFLGTAVMNAYIAEHCSPRGLRIFLHRDFVTSHLEGIPGVKPIASELVSLDSCPDPGRSNSHTEHEINYLHHKLRERTGVKKEPVDSDALIERVSIMLSNAPEQHQEHYANTLSVASPLEGVMTHQLKPYAEYKASPPVAARRSRCMVNQRADTGSVCPISLPLQCRRRSRDRGDRSSGPEDTRLAATMNLG